MSVLTNEQKVEILSEIVAIPSVNDNELAVAQYLAQWLNQYDIDTHIDYISGQRANLIATIGSGKPVVAVSGHMDVVNEGNHDDWTSPPFELTERNGHLYGRGAADMKSGLAALVIAMIEIKASGQLKNGTIKLLATAGEEMEQAGSEQLYRKGYMDDVDALVIAEPSYPSIVYAHKGSMDIKITSKGRSSHSSTPFMGENAITPLIELIQNINQAYEDITQSIKGTALDYGNMVNQMADQLPSFVSKDEVQTRIQGLVMTNSMINGGSQVNSVPDHATATFNVRTIPEYDNTKVKALFEKYINEANQRGAHLTHDIYLDLDPVVTTGDNHLFKLGHQLAQTYFDSSALIDTPTVAVTDASNLLKGKSEAFPFLMIGPGQGPHQIDECVNKVHYLKFIDYYIELLLTYLNKN
ncbi:ArgE/DapE family deacylase [Staphylococcus warneri]|uniref:Probable succinyl-diaminopimelate desuccinylase n=1 Tax=Staphylococcus warneri TaxID=1292 RepID=A0A2T4Q2Y0_STAWA|nr:ArgE/DapE family deacylase [Staphylococcus warneri]PTI13872.1 succinyl-diaminopimelate desuccinylase [Staphylococcus warneri]PTI18682.1 succinyl-diaminopimelate desuccinylase [Staphylococcus warneri]PTI24484.1 succinyl-diaminopimelate desuccinylase [Staphylococcus warneri]PTI32271.1 succinyl-diaminopimelate desuccinylase [Staphylococcus warneri]PTI52247.1 succinyl-diaminopimelate desuccinylase [Staphylococcus warneri]